MPRTLRGQRLRRERPRLLVAVLLALVVFGVVLGEVVDQVGNSTPAAEAENAATWSVGAGVILVQSEKLAALIAQVEADPRGLDRTTLDAAMRELESETALESRTFAAFGVAPPNSDVADFVERALTERASAATSFGLAATLATGPGHDVGAAQAACTRAGSEASAGDADLAELTRGLRHIKGAELPVLRPWTSTAPALDASSCSTLVSALRGNPALALDAKLDIVAVSIEPNPYRIVGLPTTTSTTSTSTTSTTSTTLPAGAIGPGGALVTTTTVARPTATTTPTPPPTTLQIPPAGSRSYILAPGGTIHVEVVVADTGTGAVGPLMLSAQLLGAAGAPSPHVKIDAGHLDAGGAVYESLGPLSVKHLGASLTLLVTASSPGTAPASARVALDVG